MEPVQENIPHWLKSGIRDVLEELVSIMQKIQNRTRRKCGAEQHVVFNKEEKDMYRIISVHHA